MLRCTRTAATLAKRIPRNAVTKPAYFSQLAIEATPAAEPYETHKMLTGTIMFAGMLLMWRSACQEFEDHEPPVPKEVLAKAHAARNSKLLMTEKSGAGSWRLPFLHHAPVKAAVEPTQSVLHEVCCNVDDH
jgi:hypothetical protein